MIANSHFSISSLSTLSILFRIRKPFPQLNRSLLKPTLDPHSNVPPKITDRKPFIVVDKGDQVMLPCANQGSPEPQTAWYQILNPNVTNSLVSSSGLSSLPSASLSSSGSRSTSSNFQNSYPESNRIRIGTDRSNDRVYQWNTNLVIRDAALEHSKLGFDSNLESSFLSEVQNLNKCISNLLFSFRRWPISVRCEQFGRRGQHRDGSSGARYDALFE